MGNGKHLMLMTSFPSSEELEQGAAVNLETRGDEQKTKF